MKSYKLILFYIVGAMIISPVYAQPKGYKVLKDSTAFIKKFNEKSKTILSNEADFSQEKYISVMTENAISKGKFYYKRPDLMRWETIEPQNHVIVLSKGKMMIREKGKVKTYDATSNKCSKD